MMSGRWFRIAPEDSSTPLQTMSYCQALISSGSIVSSASSSPCGIENGLWLKSTFLASSSYSNIGKSTIQHSRNASCSISSSFSAVRVRVLARGEEHPVVGSQPKRRDQRRGRRFAVVLGDRPGGDAFLDVDIAQ